jgi:hypothetical protein
VIATTGTEPIVRAKADAAGQFIERLAQRVFGFGFLLERVDLGEMRVDGGALGLGEIAVAIGCGGVRAPGSVHR